MFSLKVQSTLPFEYLKKSIDEQLANRTKITTADYEQIMIERKQNYGRMDTRPKLQPQLIRKGAFFLQQIKQHGQRVYAKLEGVELDSASVSGPGLSASTPAGQRLMALTGILKPSLQVQKEQQNAAAFDKFYKKTIGERRQAVDIGLTLASK